LSNITATLTTAPDNTPAKTNTPVQNKGPVLGIAIRNLTEAESRQLGIEGGVYIQEVMRGGLAAQSRLMPEDIITQINNTPVRNSDEFVNAVSKLKKNTVARVALIRQGQRAILGLRIQ